MSTATTVLLWIAAVTALVPGMMKLVMAEKMLGDPKMAWVEREGVSKARLAGAAEVAAAMAFVGTAIGLGFLENGYVAIAAALGMVAAMMLALKVHQPHGEPIVGPAVIALINLVLIVALISA